MPAPPWMKSIVIEPYIFLMCLTIGMSFVPLEQLQQDKICVNEFNQTIDFCLKLSESPTSDMKLAILVRSNKFAQFASMFNWIPALMWCLIVGSICDRYPNTRKPFMIATVFSGLLRDAVLILNVINFYNWGNYCCRFPFENHV